jgi:PhnB protein
MSDCKSFVPHLIVSNAAKAIDFYTKAFGATELSRFNAPGTNKIMHASLKINGGTLFLNDDMSESTGEEPTTAEALGGSPVILHLQVDNADRAWKQAVAAGAQVAFPLADQFWGERYGQLRDPFGLKWSISQTVSKPTNQELEKGAKASLERAREHAHV